MTAYEEDPTDASTIASLLAEVHAAEEVWREGELPPLTTTDRLALRAARRLLLRSRHRRERTGDPRAESPSAHTFEHRYDLGPLR